MKTCPHCHIQVGGSAQYCPLCQNPLVGTPEPDRYLKVVPPARQTSLFYRIAAFVLLGAAVICGVVDYIMTEGRHMHWSLLVLIGAVGVLLLLRALLRQGRNAPKLLFQILIGTSLIVTFADYYAGWNGIAIDAIVPILCSRQNETIRTQNAAGSPGKNVHCAGHLQPDAAGQRRCCLFSWWAGSEAARTPLPTLP